MDLEKISETETLNNLSEALNNPIVSTLFFNQIREPLNNKARILSTIYVLGLIKKNNIIIENVDKILCNLSNITLDFIHDLAKFNLEEDFIKRYKLIIPWNKFSKTLPKSFLTKPYVMEYAGYLNWIHISGHMKLTENMIEVFSDYVDWQTIAMKQDLSETFIRKHGKRLNWAILMSHKKISEELLIEHCNECDENKKFWKNLSKYQILSPNFIDKYGEKLSWSLVSKHQKLPEILISKYKSRVYWPNIFTYQKLSYKFMRKISCEDFVKDNMDYKLMIQKLMDKFEQENIEEVMGENMCEITEYNLSKYNISEYNYNITRTDLITQMRVIKEQMENMVDRIEIWLKQINNIDFYLPDF